MTKTQPQSPADSTVTYAELRQKLDTLVTQLQDPDCDVDQASEMYAQAMAVIAELEAYVQSAENKVRKVQAGHAD